MEERETLMSLRPQTSHEKLIWERHANKALSEELKIANTELGVLRSEYDELQAKFDAFIDSVKKSNNPEERLAWLNEKHKIKCAEVHRLEVKLSEYRKREDRLIENLSKLNLKLKSYEEKEQ